MTVTFQHIWAPFSIFGHYQAP